MIRRKSKSFKLVKRLVSMVVTVQIQKEDARVEQQEVTKVAARKEAVDKLKVESTRKRYLILFLFCLNSGNKAFQWMQIPASTKKVTLYYGVENFVVNATSVVFMVSFIPLSLPACFIIKHIGLRRAVMLGSFGTALGSIIKCFSCDEGDIYTLFVGQLAVSMSEQLIFSVPSRLASVWFPDHQVSSALAVCILGNQLGVALAFLIPQLTLNDANTKEEIGLALYQMFFYTALLSVAALVADFFLFDDAPKHAPGLARLKQMIKEKEQQDAAGQANTYSSEVSELGKQACALLSNRHYAILTLSYGIQVGLSYTVPTVLNQMLEPIWPDQDILIGTTGFLIIVGGALSSPFWGQILDRYRKYLLITRWLTLASILSLVAFAIALTFMRSPAALYLSAFFYGSAQIGVLVAGLELAIELTYPVPELVSSTLMNITPQIFGTAFVFIASYITDTHGALAANSFNVSCLLVALIMLHCIFETLNRQEAALVVEKESPSKDKSLTLEDEF